MFVHTGGRGGLKIPKNPSTWFMDVPLDFIKFSGLCSGLEIKVNKSKRQQYCTDNGIAYEFDNECVPIVNQVLKSNVKIEK